MDDLKFKHFLQYLYYKAKAIVFLILNSELAKKLMELIKTLSNSSKIKTALKVMIGYTSVCLLIEMIKQFFVYKHHQYLIIKNEMYI